MSYYAIRSKKSFINSERQTIREGIVNMFIYPLKLSGIPKRKKTNVN